MGCITSNFYQVRWEETVQTLCHLGVLFPAWHPDPPIHPFAFCFSVIFLKHCCFLRSPMIHLLFNHQSKGLTLVKNLFVRYLAKLEPYLANTKHCAIFSTVVGLRLSISAQSVPTSDSRSATDPDVLFKMAWFSFRSYAVFFMPIFFLRVDNWLCDLVQRFSMMDSWNCSVVPDSSSSLQAIPAD